MDEAEDLTKYSGFICPNCNAKVAIEDLGMVMFSSATVFSCPVCNKTIAIQPKGEEFEILKHLDQQEEQPEEQSMSTDNDDPGKDEGSNNDG